MTTSMDQLIEAAMNQNFVPVVDDRGIFIGIVRRQAIIRYCYDKARTEPGRPRAPRMPAPRQPCGGRVRPPPSQSKPCGFCQIPRRGSQDITEGS